MKPGHSSRHQQRSGFTLLEMIVNIGLLLVVMLVVASIAGHTSETVHSNSGKLAAAEKTETVRHALMKDLGAIVRLDSGGSELACTASDDLWKLELRVPGGSGWQQIGYAWSKATGSLTRSSTVNGKQVETVIGTGITGLVATWLESITHDPATAARQWSNGAAPPLAVRVELETTRGREEGKRDGIRELHEKSSNSVFFLPVGGGGDINL